MRALLLSLLAAALLAGCGGGREPVAAGPEEGPGRGDGPRHVHGLGVNPADGALYIATHTGLWRAPAGETSATRVGDLRHDLMGFTVAGPDSFLASGHPDPRQDLPPLLGLQRSTDAGRSWEAVSLVGEADLHVLRATGEHVYGVDSLTGYLLASSDGGRSWRRRQAPAPVLDLAVAPGDPRRLVAAGEQGMFGSGDGGRSWKPLRDDVAGLLAWPARDALYVVDEDGAVARSTDGGREFERLGSLGTRPEAFTAEGAEELYAAVHGGKVLASADGGAAWRTRSTP